MPHTKFQAFEQSGSEQNKKIFNIFLCISMVPTKDSLARSRLDIWDLHLNKHSEGSPGGATYHILSRSAKQFLRRRVLSIFYF